MKQLRLSLLCLGITVLFFTGCATGPRYSSSPLPPLAPADGRIFFYRAPLWSGSAIQPVILVDGNRVGTAVPGGVFYVDFPPGPHTVSCEGIAVTLHLHAGESRYVSMENHTGGGDIFWHVRPILIAPDQGSQEILRMHLIQH